MTMGDGEKIIGKVEKGFQLITKAKNMRLHLKGKALQNNTALDILRALMRDSCSHSREVEILSLTKMDAKKDFAFITLTTKESRDELLNKSLTYHSERLKVSITKGKEMGSIDGTEPNQTAIRLAHAPVQEVVAQKTQAMSNTAATSPLVSKKIFTKVIKELAETMDNKLTMLTNNINLNTDMRIEAFTDMAKIHATNIHNIMSAMAMEFQQSNHRIHNIMQTLTATSLDSPPARLPYAPGPPLANTHVSNNNVAILVPPRCFSAHYRGSPSSLHKGQYNLHE